LDDELLDVATSVLEHGLRQFRGQRSGDLSPWVPTEPLAELLAGHDGRLPVEGTGLQATSDFLVSEVLTRPTGNTHPNFFGWVHGSGDEIGIVTAIMAASMNANTGGRDHGAVHIEQTVLSWFRQIFGFAQGAGAVFTQGSSESSLLALAVARTNARRASFTANDPREEVVYAGNDVHESVTKCARILQFGHLRHVGSGTRTVGMSPEILRQMIRSDRESGRTPACVVATAGAIDSGGCDPLLEISDVCREERVWLHVDGAFGAWLRIAPPPFDTPVRGIDRADSLAFDVHKWLPVPFAAGVLLVADREIHRETFASAAEYLSPSDGLAGGPDWAVNYGVALSRPFQGLAPYAVLRVRGLRAIGEGIAYCVVLAHYFAHLVEQHPNTRLAAPVVGNVVLFHAVSADGQSLPADDVAAGLQLSGRSVFSTTALEGRRVLRACFVNHNTRPRHVDQAMRELEEFVGRFS
jgi:aromatic-L-amino-acid decarboxylase